MAQIINNINFAADCLRSNDVVAIPTETVYGLAANALSEEAIVKIFEMKNRPFYNPLIVHIGEMEGLLQVACDIPDVALKLAEVFWPGPLTLVLNKQSTVPAMITANKSTVAVRMPNHALTLKLLNILDFPLAAPSANPFGSISPTTVQHVERYFKYEPLNILDGGSCSEGIESTIIGFKGDTPVLYRYGSVSADEIENIAGKLIVHTQDNKAPDAPGMLLKHYSPATPSILVCDIFGYLSANPDKRIGCLTYREKVDHPAIITQQVLSPSGDLKEAAKNLYSALHILDQNQLDLILIEKLPDYGVGRSINDRLTRATS